MHPAKRRSRRRRLLTRTLPLVALAVAAFGLGIYVSGAPGRTERGIIRRYVDAWAHGEYSQMYALLSPSSRRHTSELQFAAELEGAAQTATLRSMQALPGITVDADRASVRFRIRTRVFGVLRETLTMPLSGSGGGTTVRYSTTLLFPGLRPGELLSSHTRLGHRGSLLAADGTPLAEGRHLSSPIPEVADEIAGTVGPIPPDEATLYADEGYPANARVGLDGLEAIFQQQLAGRLGGRLLAGSRLLASVQPGNGATVRTTIVPKLEEDAIGALAGAYAGMVVMNPRDGAVLAAAGLAFTAPQPPGSTFKIITASAVLQDHLAKLSTQFPYVSSVDLDGFTLQNAGKEVCGGSLLDAFAQSCDTVFAPLGAELGARRLVGMAERFGFNRPTGSPAVLASTIPSAVYIGSPLAVGDSAIGQGEVLATPLEMADAGATIADGGRRPVPTFQYGAKPRFVHVVSHRVAADVQKMMEAVVTNGTGVTAQIPGVRVAGKTGTAELRNTAGKQNEKKATDAWFVGYAPAGRPGSARFVVCALYPGDGYGEQSAAPPVKSVLESALGIG